MSRQKIREKHKAEKLSNSGSSASAEQRQQARETLAAIACDLRNHERRQDQLLSLNAKKELKLMKMKKLQDFETRYLELSEAEVLEYEKSKRIVSLLEDQIEDILTQMAGIEE